MEWCCTLLGLMDCIICRCYSDSRCLLGLFFRSFSMFVVSFMIPAVLFTIFTVSHSVLPIFCDAIRRWFASVYGIMCSLCIHCVHELPMPLGTLYKLPYTVSENFLAFHSIAMEICICETVIARKAPEPRKFARIELEVNSLSRTTRLEFQEPNSENRTLRYLTRWC